MRSRGTAIMLLIAMAVLSGCGDERDKAEKKFQQVDQNLTAWSSTLDLAGEQARRHDVPQLYIRQLIKRASKQLDEQEEDLAELPASDPRRREYKDRVGQIRAQAKALASDATVAPSSGSPGGGRS